MTRFWLILGVPLLALAGCRNPSPPAPKAGEAGTAAEALSLPGFHLERQTVEREDLAGFSGLATDGLGQLWGTPEDDRVMAPVGAPAGRGDVRLEGLPFEWDVESVAWLGPELIAVGTERLDPRDSDSVFLMRLQGQVATVTEQIDIPYAPWQLEAAENRGIEGLCHTPTHLVIGNENSHFRGERPMAPLATYELATKTLATYRVALGNPPGKLSALACRVGPAGLEVLLMERDFGFARLLRVAVPANPKPEPRDLEPVVLADLSQLSDPLPNFEGLSWYADGTIAILNDNQYGRVTGPTELLLLEPEPTTNDTP